MISAFFGTTTLLPDDGKDQVLFDAHMTRPSLPRFVEKAERRPFRGASLRWDRH